MAPSWLKKAINPGEDSDKRFIDDTELLLRYYYQRGKDWIKLEECQ